MQSPISEQTDSLTQNYYTSFRAATTPEQLNNARKNAEEVMLAQNKDYEQTTYMLAIQSAYEKVIVEKAGEKVAGFEELQQKKQIENVSPKPVKRSKAFEEFKAKHTSEEVELYKIMDNFLPPEAHENPKAFIKEFNAWLLKNGLDPEEFPSSVNDSGKAAPYILAIPPTDFHTEKVKQFLQERQNQPQEKNEQVQVASITTTPISYSLPSAFSHAIQRKRAKAEQEEENYQSITTPTRPGYGGS